MKRTRKKLSLKKQIKESENARFLGPSELIRPNNLFLEIVTTEKFLPEKN